MNDRFTNYNEVINNLLSEAISCTPENWTKGTLNIMCDGQRIEYSLKNEEEEGAASISSELAQLAESTYLAFAQQGDVWTEARFDFNQDEDGGWRLSTKFTYPE